MQEVLLLLEEVKPLFPAVGSWGSLPGGQFPGKAAARVPPARQPRWVREGRCPRGRGCCPQAGHRSCGPLPFPTPRCARGEDGRARAELLSQLCHRPVSQGESESLRTELCPSGVTALPLPFLPPSRLLGAGASPHGAPGAARPCSPPAQTSPTGAEPVAGAERDAALHPAGQAEPKPYSRAQRGGENGSLSAETSRKAPWAP